MGFLNLCHFCVKYVDKKSRIAIDVTIREQFKQATNLFLKKADFFPDFICEKCMSDLNTIHRIRTEFIESQNVLEKMYEEYLEQQSERQQETRKVVRIDVPIEIKDEPAKENVIEIKDEPPEIEVRALPVIIEVNPGVSNGSQAQHPDIPSSSNVLEPTVVIKSENEYTTFEIMEHEEFPAESELSDNGLNYYPSYLQDSLMSFEDSMISDTSMHNSTLSRGTEVSCPYCRLSMKREDLGKHIEYSHLNTKNYVCDVCHAQFYLKTALRDHLLEHFQIEDNSCLECTEILNSRVELENHIKAVHEESEVQGFRGMRNIRANVFGNYRAERRCKREQIEKRLNKHPVIVKENCSKCQKNCYLNFSHDRRIEINSEFWTSNLKGRRNFLSNYATNREMKRFVEPNQHGEYKKKFSYNYHLKNQFGVDVEVCQSFFVNTLGFQDKNRKFVARLLNSKATYKRKPAEKDVEMREKIKKHIYSFKPIIIDPEPGNSQSQRRLFLPHKMTIRSMHDRFMDDIANCSYSLYNKMVKQLKVSFLKPQN